jgi:uncharacterized protein YkwD
MSSTMPNRTSIFSARSIFVVVVAALSAVLSMGFTAPAAQARCKGEGSMSKRQAASAMFCLLNQERAKRGIGRLHHDAKLARVAGRHARHMVRYSFTGHNSPKAGGLVQRVKRAHVFSRTRAFSVGENLGWGGSPRAINSAWMRSAIHKKATLLRNFTKVGIGVVRGLPHGSKRRSLTYVVTFAG